MIPVFFCCHIFAKNFKHFLAYFSGEGWGGGGKRKRDYREEQNETFLNHGRPYYVQIAE
jgi:hypothetical protein